MYYTYQDVQAEINAMTYFLPPQTELLPKLRERKLTPMQVSMQRYADFVTGDLEGFLRYVRANNVRTVMFSYAYYTEKDLDDLYKLDSSDKSVFVNHSRDVTKYHEVPFHRIHQPQSSDLTDYANYLRYSRYVRSRLDLSRPKELRLYAVVQGKVIACQLGDAWLQRLNLVNRTSLRLYTMEHNMGAGSLTFQFADDPTFV